MPDYLSVDLGAESGRVTLGIHDDDRLHLEEVARFPTGTTRIRGRLHWDVAGMFEEIKRTLKSVADSPAKPESIGVDSWGVDFALLAGDGALLELPVAYRDSRTEGMMEKLFERVPPEEIYRKTGIQFMQINTLYQLFAMAERKSPLLRAAKDLLFIPDYFNHLLTGKKVAEFTNATTSQFFNVHENRWDDELLEIAGVSPSLMQEIVQPGTPIGHLTKELREDTGLADIPVIAPATHDTGSAVAAAPAEGDDWAYISSGTWSLMGIEIREPVTTEKAQNLNFTNEGGVDGTYRFLKNIMGLWLLQRCRAEFDKKFEYDELGLMAAEAPAFASLIDIDDPRFLNPPSMLEAIAESCRETGQPPPQTPAAFARCVLESLALQYRTVLDELRRIHDGPIRRIHILGGGARNKPLCQMTADATGLSVIAGPAEATSVGNLIVQAKALGHIGSLRDARALVRRSFKIEEYEPAENAGWGSARERYAELKVKA